MATPPEAVAEGKRLAAAGVEVHLDTDGTQLLAGTRAPRTLVKSPGVPYDAPVVAEARARGLDVLGELELGWRMLPNEFIAVTGTNGKTTTVELIGAMHRAASAPVAVAGNVGTPLTSLVGTLDDDAAVVCEASSFQLEDTAEFDPEIAVFLNFSEDHLDRHSSVGVYLDAKLRIFANQRAEDVAVLNTDEPALRGAALGLAKQVWFGESPDCALRLDGDQLFYKGAPLIKRSEIRLRGRHNLENAMAAAAAALSRGLDPDAVRTALREFPGVEHRLEQVAEIDGIAFVNDSKATNVAAAAAALRSFDAGVHAILGGSLKGGGFEGLAPAVSERGAGCYLIGEAASRLERDLAETEVELFQCGDLGRAVSEAARRAKSGETVLLAPACASYDQYTNFEERGEHFRALVADLARAA
jgi:UDP-N-acetylmuramoylalanine--D-glutamate ligase